MRPANHPQAMAATQQAALDKAGTKLPPEAKAPAKPAARSAAKPAAATPAPKTLDFNEPDEAASKP